MMSTSEVLQSSSSTDTTTCISRNGDAKLPGENTVSLTKEGTNQDENAVAVSNDPTVTPEEGEGPVSVAVCGVTGAGDKVCVTVCSEEEEKRQERGRNEDILPNGKPASATFPRRHQHNSSFSSTHSGRLSPYGSEGQSSSSDGASLFSESQNAIDLQLVVEQLKHELLSKCRGGRIEGGGGGGGGGGGSEGVEDGHQVEGEDLLKTLLEHVVTLKMELANLKEENEKLRHVRSNMDTELHQLTENLFEEAYKMVDEAKGGKVSAEKRLADAAGRIDAMETEMSTLKRLIQSSQSPASHSSPKITKGLPQTLHPPHPPNLHSLAQRPRRTSIRRAVHKIQKRTGLGLHRSYSGSSTKGAGSPLMLLEHTGGMKGDTLVTGEIDQDEYVQFQHWIKTISPSSPTSPFDHPYFNIILDQDIRPCLSFKNAEVSKRVLAAVRENSVIMESLHASTNSNGRPGHVRSSSIPPEGTLCVLCEARERDCTHRMQLGEAQEWLFISQSCRDRVASVCDFFMHVSHIQKGIIKADTTKLYWQVARLRGLIQLSRYSLSLQSENH